MFPLFTFQIISQTVRYVHFLLMRAARLAHVGLSNTGPLTDAFTHLSHVHFGNSIKILCASLPEMLGLRVANCLSMPLFRQDSWQ
jgi:hypothetical protein